MAKPRSNIRTFIHFLRELPEDSQEDVYEFVCGLSLPGGTEFPGEEERIAKVISATKDQTRSDEEPPSPKITPRERLKFTRLFFNALSPEEQHLSIYYVLMKLQDLYQPIMGIEFAARNFSDVMRGKLEKIEAAVAITYPMIESRIMPGRNVLPDLSTLPQRDQHTVLTAEKRLAWAVANNFVATTEANGQVALVQEIARRELTKVYNKTAKLPAPDILSKSVQQGFIAAYQRAGLAQRYLS